MFRHQFFVLFLFVYLACDASGLAHADGGARLNTVELFVPGRTKVLVNGASGEVIEKEVRHFHVPLLAAADGVVVALALAEYAEKRNRSIDIVARYIETGGEDWLAEFNEGNGRNWTTRLAMQREEGGYTYLEKGVLVAARDDKMYFLLVNHRKRISETGLATSTSWEFELSISEIKSVGQRGKIIGWQGPISTFSTLTEELRRRSLFVLPYGGSALLAKDGRAVFLVRALRDLQDVSVIICLKDTGTEVEVDWSFVESLNGCLSSSLFEWEGKLIIIPTNCWDSNNGVKESVDMGKTWSDAVGTLSRVWDGLRDKEDYITATIDNKTVLLFTRSRSGGKSTDKKYEIHLWFLDGNRVHDIGPLTTDGHEIVSAGLVYTNGELLFLYEQWDQGVNGIFFTRLDYQLESIKSVLNTWNEEDAYLSRPCDETAPQGAPTGTNCLTPMPTDGLVGFLSNRGDATYWHDEYLFMNAVVRNGTRVKNGYTFSGANSGAWWSVGQDDSGKRYDFTKYGLTVVATVTIHEAPEDDIPLLTVGGDKVQERLGFWCSKDQRWKLVSKNGETLTCVWEANRTYKVAIMLQESGLSAYVDGDHVGSLFYISTPGEQLPTIEHLLISRYEEDSVKDAVSSVTVTSVFLYNRLFDASEFWALGKRLTGFADG